MTAQNRLVAASRARAARAAVLAATALVAAAIAALAASSPAHAAKAAKEICPATFHVLHDDRIGKLELPEGHYTITVLDDELLSCTRASKLFADFLQDYDGKLPDGWRVIPAKSKFVQDGTGAGFRVREADEPSGNGGGRHPARGERRCPGTFEVEHDDQIGRLRLPAGPYTITVFGNLGCSAASDKFAKFLDRPEGNLPGRWRLKARTGTFKRGDSGFRVKQA